MRTELLELSNDSAMFELSSQRAVEGVFPAQPLPNDDSLDDDHEIAVIKTNIFGIRLEVHEVNALIKKYDRAKRGGLGLDEFAKLAANLQKFKAARAARKTIFGSGCSSWYLDATGVPASWPWSYDAFAEQTAAPKNEDYEYIA